MRADKGNLALIAAFLILTSLFAYSIYSHKRPQKRVWEVKVFECIPRAGHTYVSSYGGGYLKLVGSYDLEEGAEYRITYTTTKRNWAEKVISIEKIG